MLLSPVPSPEVVAITLSAIDGQCTNCEKLLPEPKPNFCPHCGQETSIKPPTVAEFLQQFSGTYFASEGALWRTLKLLLSRPGELTARYLNGRRKQYVLPLRLFLSAAVVMLVAMRLVSLMELSALDDPAFRQALRDRPDNLALEVGVARAGMAEGQFYCDGPPPWVCQRLRKKLDTSVEVLLTQVEKVNDRLASNAGLVMLALLPGFTLALALLFRYRGLSYTEHLVFALHLHAFWFLVAAVAITLPWWLAWLALVLIPGYAGLAFRRVYGGRAWGLVWRGALLTVAHLVLVAFIVAISAVLILLL